MLECHHARVSEDLSAVQVAVRPVCGRCPAELKVASHARRGGKQGHRRATFGGATDFAAATFADGADRLPFKETRVLSPGAGDVWPTGWRPMPDSKGGHLLVRAKHDAVRANGDSS